MTGSCPGSCARQTLGLHPLHLPEPLPQGCVLGQGAPAPSPGWRLDPRRKACRFRTDWKPAGHTDLIPSLVEGKPLSHGGGPGSPQRRWRRAPGRGTGPGAQEDADRRALAAWSAAGNEVTFVKRNRPHGRRGRISLANAIQRPSGRRTLLAAAAAFLRRDSRGGVERGCAAAAPSARPQAAAGWSARGGVGQPRAGLQARITPKGAPARGKPRVSLAAPRPGRGSRGRGLRGFKAGGARRRHPGELKDCEQAERCGAVRAGGAALTRLGGLSPRPAGAGVGAR